MDPLSVKTVVGSHQLKKLIEKHMRSRNADITIENRELPRY